jgi:ABC-type phosphate/phosphonate transport system substrate-binding protein
MATFKFHAEIDRISAHKSTANITPSSVYSHANYIKARRKYGVRVIAKALRQGKPFHRAVIVRADSDIQAVSG